MDVHALHMRARKLLRLALLASLVCGLGGCVSVKPWEKAAFARPDMAFDTNPLGAALDGHIRFSKEGALPGSGGGGGGCGCN